MKLLTTINRMIRAAVLCGCAGLACLDDRAAAQTLTHRYSFFSEPSGSTVITDAVAAANGSIQGAATITGGQLVLNGASGNYGKLPAGLISGYTAVTVEAWADYGTLPANCYLFSLGNTDSGGNGEDYLFCNPQNARISISNADPGYNNEQSAVCAGWSGRTGLHVVAIFNPPAGYLALYTNGVLAAVNTAENNLLGAVSDVDSYLGRSLYTADPYAPIKVDEFRIWKGALNGLQVAADYLAGDAVTNASPGTVTNLQLSVTNQMVQGGVQNATVTARATGVPYAVDITRFCTYSSGNPAVFTVNPSNGLVTAVGPGTNVLTAQYGSGTATQTIAVALAASVLTHRYSFFSEPAGSLTATDSIAAANGALKGAAAISAGQLVLNGASGTYVSLPSGLINSGYNGVTIETWASFATNLPVSFLFGFGNTNGAFGTNYLFCTAQLGRAAITATTYYGEQGITTGGWSGQTNLHIVAVFEPPAGYVSLYTNGVLAGIDNAVTTPLSAVNDADSFIGRSLYSGDSYLPGSLSEFRIYNGALSAPQIALDAATGPAQIVTNAGALQSLQLAVAGPIAPGATQPAVVLGNFANATNVNLFTYGAPVVTTDNTNVFSVSASGAITALSPGVSANVIASYGGLVVTQRVAVSGFPTNQYAFGTFGDGFWTIANQGNGVNLVAGTTRSTQAVVTNTAAQQQFEVLYNLNNGTFRLRQQSSWLCLASLNATHAPGTAVGTVSSYSAQPAQRWWLLSAGGGYYRIFNAATNLVLQTDNGSPASVTLAEPSTSPYQLWQFNYQTHFPKKGSAGYEGSPYQGELTTGWAYNYDDNTSASEPAAFDFVPMIDTQYWEPLGDLQARDPGWVSNSAAPVYLLGFNEPDNPSYISAGTAPSTNTAIAMWAPLQALNLPLVSPATQNTEDAWENNFFSLIAANNYRVDYTAAHEYVPPSASSLISDLQSVYNAYGHPVWLTEFSPVDWSNTKAWSEDDDYNFLAEFMWQAENANWLARYAVFPFSNTNPNSPWVDNGFTGSIFLSDGQTLSPYGELYATWDGDETLHAGIPYIIHNLGTSFRLTDTNNAAAPAASDIYVRNATTEWALWPAPESGHWYVISLNDGRRLRNNGGTLDLAPIGTTNSAVDWWFNGPDANGYYYLDNLAAAQSLEGAGTAPSIAFGMINDPAPSTATRWRLVKPYQPVTINTNESVPVLLVAAAGSGTVSLGWTGGGGAPYFSLYRANVSGGPYTRIAGPANRTGYLDSGVTNGVTYYYVVTAMNQLGVESADSVEFSATPSSSVATNLTFAAQAGGTLQLSWPADHTGWTLQVQTNGAGTGLSTNWQNVGGSTTTNQVVVPVVPANGAVFYRLVYP
jgi:hypothetical protein